MAYGISVTNSDGEYIIQDQQEIFVQKRAGTISHFKYSTRVGSYGYQIANGSSEYPTGTEDVYFQLPVGGWVAYWPWILFVSDGQSTAYTELAFSRIVSNQSTLNYGIFDRISVVGTSTSGYGAQVLNASGLVLWDAALTTNRVSKGGTVVSNASYIQTTSVSSTANAASLRANECHIRKTGQGYNLMYGWTAYRQNSTTWQITKRAVDAGFYPYQGRWFEDQFNRTITYGDARYLLAYL